MKRAMSVMALLGLFFILASTAAHAQDAELLYKQKFCSTCHGQKGVSIAPNYPNLANQNELYLINQINDIINKKRTNKLTPLMTLNPVINTIRAEEIATIAAHMNKLKPAGRQLP